MLKFGGAEGGFSQTGLSAEAHTLTHTHIKSREVSMAIGEYNRRHEGKKKMKWRHGEHHVQVNFASQRVQRV